MEVWEEIKKMDDAKKAELVREKFKEFILGYKEENKPIYKNKIDDLVRSESTTLAVDFEHIKNFNSILAVLVDVNFYLFENSLREGLEEYIKSIDSQVERSFHYYVSIVNYATPLTIRHIRSDKIGQLFCFSGTVTKSSDVRPELIKGTFKCHNCGTLIENVKQNFQYTTPTACPNKSCNNHSKFDLVVGKSTFVDWQRLNVQENPDSVTSGSVPRHMEVILRNDLVETVKPGDRCIFVGTPVAIPDTARRVIGEPITIQRPAGFEVDGVTGVKGYGVRELNYRLSFLASSALPLAENTDAAIISKNVALTMRESANNIYTKVANSIAPHIYAHMEVKRGIALMLLGGRHKKTADGMKLRGDINVCIVGDPSTAKSQFLKFVSNLMPRAVYTSGQSSSAAGLTASVTKDPETGDFTIEAGALMLADNGVCCIDEFDKMNATDQVAIHEAMEQQTISISKAGIQATLNARSSVLAAANPINGRYDRSKTLRANLNLTAPIMSRFDLFFVIVDECKPEMDRKIAKHIIEARRGIISEVDTGERFTSEDLRKYIRYARTIEPELSEEAARELKLSYTKLRNNDAASFSRASYRITVRQLEALIRLSEAIAKLHLDTVVRKQYVQEATRLLEHSIVQIESEPIVLDVPQEERDEDEREAEAKKSSLKISYDDYVGVAKAVLSQVMSLEDGTTETELCEWWVETGSRGMPSFAQYDAEQSLAIFRAILQRLIAVDFALFETPTGKIIEHPNRRA